MTKRFFALGLALLALPAFATRPSMTEAMLLVRLNGVPAKLGVITTAGVSTTNVTTATPFTVANGSVLKVTCDAAAVFTIGSSASTSYTNAAFGAVMAAGVAQYFVIRDGDNTVAVASAVTVNCAVHNMQ